MLCIFIIIYIFSRPSLQMQTFQRQLYVDRKSQPLKSSVSNGIVYSKIGDGLDTTTSHFDTTIKKPIDKYAETAANVDLDKDNEKSKTNTTNCQVTWKTKSKDKGTYLPKRNDESAKAKTKCIELKNKNEHGTTTLHSKSAIHSDSSLNIMNNIFKPYTADKEFRIDVEDVRTDSKNTLNGWPYSYKTLNDYHVQNLSTKNEKAKDKRFFTSDAAIDPINENVAENIPAGYISNTSFVRDAVTDNPNYGNQPFFSFVLNDYFDRHQEEDPLIFKDFTWAEEFDNGLHSQDLEDNDRRSRRLHDHNDPAELQNEQKTKSARKESIIEKFQSNSGKYEKYPEGQLYYDHEDSNHKYKGHREIAFKDFADLFANKFGLENRNSNSNYKVNTNKDAGEKRKGFKRVYHKDEYEEDNDFYDNTNKSIQSEESGGLKVNNGGSHAILRSQTFGSAGNEANSLIKRDNKHEKTFKGKERDNDINHYIDIAKDAAQSNNEDYIGST